MNKELNIIKGHGQVSSLVALGFYAVGLVSLVAVLGILLGYPQTLAGDPYRLEVLGLGVLAILGFVASFIFGTYYAVSSLLSGTGLWSRKLALWHLLLHVVGLGWMAAAFAGMTFLENPYSSMFIGGMAILAGVLILVLNIVCTASQFNRWEPAQITVMSSLFWLGLASVFVLGLVVERFYPFMGHEPLELARMHGYLAVAGFLWLGVLGASLKLFSMFTVGGRMPGVMSWIGCAVINGALMLTVPVLLFDPPWAYPVLTAIILIGSLFYLGDAVRMFAGASKGVSAGVLGAMAGLVMGLVLLGWLAAGTPGVGSAETVLPGETARMMTSLAILGTGALVFLGMGTRVIPFLVWRVRCMPLVGRSEQPAVNSLADARSPSVTVFCLLVGWIYILAGQFSGNAAGTQLGVLCLLVGACWFLHAVRPSLQAFFLGIEPVSKPNENRINS